MRNWADVLPEQVAISQHAYERRRQANGMRRVGMTYREIGAKLGVCTPRAAQIVGAYMGDKPSPIELYLAGMPGDDDQKTIRRWLRKKS